MNRTEILQQDLQRRIQEEFEYQINIDNYRLAIAKIEAEHSGWSGMDRAMRRFSKKTLQAMLDQSLIEQRKTIIMKEVIQEQLNAIS